jgi:acetyl-CoA carboxylase carboxyl transferase subunit alpha
MRPFVSDKQPKSSGDTTASGMAFERPIQELESQLSELEALSLRTQLDISSEIEALRKRLKAAIESTYQDLSAWETVNVARHQDRPVTSDYVSYLLEDWLELHGDKVFGDDPAIITGLATMAGRRFLLVAHRKGRTTKERLACNFGCAHPEGYRKALRKMRLAEKLGLPIVSLINTPGAYPGIGAEERGQATAIAENILAMLSLRVPILVIVIGEGGSGGALGIGVGDRVLMLQYAYYSVISPEGCAAILWKDGERTPEAAEALRLTSKDLLALGVIDGVIPEPPGGAHRAPTVAMEQVKRTILRELDGLMRFSPQELVEGRRQRFRRMGVESGRFPSL